MIQLHDKKYTCPIDFSLSFIDGKWKILILSHLYYCNNRSYSDFCSNLPGVSEKMLSQQLKELERDKLISKTIISKKPYRVEYSLTELGKTLTPLFQFLSEWGIQYLKQNGIDYIKDQHLYKFG